MKIRVGSRESKLAVIQSQIVIDCIKKHHKNVEIELITMKTTGDIILNKTLDKIGGKGLFVKELDKALLENRVDITVHSFKDMPMEIPQNLPIIAVSKREKPNDVLILPKNCDKIDFSKPIGCASARRKIQIQKLYPNCTVEPIRGNVLTRLEKLDSGEFSALILAYAGIKRLNLEHRIHKIFNFDEMIPSACQGVIVVQAREDFDIKYLAEFNDENTFLTSKCERAFVEKLDGSCSSPIASFATICNEDITITGMYVDDNNAIFIDKLSGKCENNIKIAEKLANILKEKSK